MHDIICPDCGERFLGYDVAFDMSEYVLPLLYSNEDDADTVKQVKFKYYVDEEVILQSNKSCNPALLECISQGGPGLNDEVFTFTLNGKILFEYILSKSGQKYEELLPILDNLKSAVQSNNFKSINALNLAKISTLYHVLFDASGKLVGEISTDDENVRTAIKILVHIYNQKEDTQSLDLKVAVFSSKVNGIDGYHVPDILFVQHHGNYQRIKKCCRFCGSALPLEFGYYKMKPVVLLGSHSSGKTSYLLSLLNTVLSKTPFIGDTKIATSTLNDDDNLRGFMGNIERFRKGLGPVKTDFKHVPILNLKIKDTIYSFIDWPGEKFISGAGADDDYVYKSRRVITHARHVLFFLPPEQIDSTLPTTEENVCFNTMDLSQSLQWHMAFPDHRRIRSLIYVANKVDKFRGRDNTETMFSQIDEKSEVNIFSGGAWNEAEYNLINSNMSDYIQIQNPALYNVLFNVNTGMANVEKYFLPVSPYGYDAEREENPDNAGGIVIHRGFLSGLPFLRILRTDGII